MTQFVTRREAGLRPPSGGYMSIADTVTGATGHWGGPSPWGRVDRSSPQAFLASTAHARCASIWRAWQDAHMAKGWVDLAYTSGCCPHGVRFEGRPTWARTAAQGTNEGNRVSSAVVYIGGEGDPFTDLAKWAFVDEEMRLGRQLRWCHNDWHSTACPGDPMCQWIRAGTPAPAAPQPGPSPVHPVPPSVVYGPRVEVDDVGFLRYAKLAVHLDDRGNGDQDIACNYQRLISAVPEARNPRPDDPNVPKGHTNPGVVGQTPVSPHVTRVVITDGPPKATIGVHCQVLED